MKRIFKAPSNWEWKEEIFLADKTLEFILAFELNIMRKYFKVNEYKVLVDVCQDIDFLVSARYKNKLEQLFNDPKVRVKELSVNSNDNYIFFPRGEVGNYELIDIN